MGYLNIVEAPKETRDLSFNIWHRTQAGLAGVDIDFVEICTKCQKPIAFIELVRDNGNNVVDIYNKCSMVTDYIAWLVHRPSFVVFYRPNDTSDSIHSVKVKQMRPTRGKVVEMSADQFADFLRYLHRDHVMICKKQRKGAVNEIERGTRMQSKEWLELDVVPSHYSDDEVMIFAGKVADQYMERRFGSSVEELNETIHDDIRNNIAEAMESVMRDWEGQADAPLAVELVERMNLAGDAVVRSIRII